MQRIIISVQVRRQCLLRRFHLLKIAVGRIILIVQVLTDDPLTQSVNQLAKFIIDQPEEISRFVVFLIQI